MGEKNMRFSPYVSPDSMRKFLQISKALYDTHTPKNFGRKDVNDLPYSGIVENYGTDLFIETRKLMMDKPPLSIYNFNNGLLNNFSFMYSDLIDTYEQELLLDIFLKNKSFAGINEVHLKFDYCEDWYVLRSKSWSDPDVYKSKFIRTKRPIKLYKDNAYESISYTDKPGFNAWMCFNVSLMNEDLIESYENDTLILKNVDPISFNKPLFSLWCESLKTLPNFDFVNNKDINNKPLLSVGTDGHSISHLYPYVYGENNVPVDIHSDNKKWFIKLTPYDLGEDYDINTIENEKLFIEKISYVYTDDIDNEPEHVTDITFNHDYIRITPNDNVNWIIHDNELYVELSVFNDNTLEDGIMIPVLDVLFDSKYLHEFEPMMLNNVSGIHINSSSDYCHNSIPTKNGIIHSMGDFDGLPESFKNLLNEDQHRSRVELYSIRDRLNDNNINVTKKQISGLIIDSGIPKMKSDIIDVDLPTGIKYDYNRNRVYYSLTTTSSKNVPMSLAYKTGNRFVDVDKDPNLYNQRWIYHGNRYFSLNVMGKLDPEKEYGRVYVISNDSTEYSNNGKNNDKPKRTLARVCDIPTKFTDLIHIENVSPTLVIDEMYIRSKAPYTHNTQDKVWNGMGSTNWAKVQHIDNGKIVNSGIFDYYMDLDNTFGVEYDGMKYVGCGQRINLNPYLSMRKTRTEVGVGGSGYNVGDTFYIYIAGFVIDGTVTEVSDGSVTGFTLTDYLSLNINIHNFESRIITRTANVVTGTGDGFTVSIIIDENEWNKMHSYDIDYLYNDECRDGLYTFKKDKNGFIWVYEFDIKKNQWYKASRFTGIDLPDNIYDNEADRNTRRVSDVLLRNLNKSYKNISDRKYLYTYSLNKSNISHNKMTLLEYSNRDVLIEADEKGLLGEELDKQKFNNQDSLYVLSKREGYEIYDLMRFDTSYSNAFLTNDLPRFNNIHLENYIDKANRIVWCKKDGKPLLYLGYYNPKKKTYQKLKQISYNRFDVESESTITIGDTLSVDNVHYNVDDKGNLINNVYKYNEYNEPQEIIDLRYELERYSKDMLIDYIKKNITDDSIIFSLDYDKNQLINYIISNYYDETIFHVHKPELIGKKNDSAKDIVVEGGYELLTKPFDPNVKVGIKSYTTEFKYIFKIDEFNPNDEYVLKETITNNTIDNSECLIVSNSGVYINIHNEWKKVIHSKKKLSNITHDIIDDDCVLGH